MGGGEGNRGALLDSSVGSASDVSVAKEQQQQQQQQYDTLISVNVLEHVQDAFQYLTGLYRALRRGGTLIMHERYYDDLSVVDGDGYHPVRVKKAVLDKFLSLFHITFNNCSAEYEGRPGEHGYYVIGRKL